MKRKNIWADEKQREKPQNANMYYLLNSIGKYVSSLKLSSNRQFPCYIKYSRVYFNETFPVCFP